MASNHKLGSRERQELEKFTKFLVYKCFQIIVQSRLGERIKTRSRQYNSSRKDWFYLAIDDLSEITQETKTLRPLAIGRYVCIEISLKTTEGESLSLETWSLNMTNEKDPFVPIYHQVYNRMGLLLKSLLCTSRVTPAYRLSRRQGPDTYVMCYRMYSSEPETNLLGPGQEVKTVGKVPTPGGTIYLQVHYRTKMLISPQSSREIVENLKDDYFTVDGSPKHGYAVPMPCMLRKDKISVTEEGFALGESEFSVSSFGTTRPTGYMPPVNQAQRNGVYGPTSENGVTDDKESKANFKNKLSLEQIGALVSDGESEDEVDSKTGQERSAELPFVQLVKEMSEMRVDNNANTMSNSKTKDSQSNGHHLNGDSDEPHCSNGLDHAQVQNGFGKNTGFVANGSHEVNGQRWQNGGRGSACLERLRHASGESTSSRSSASNDDYVLVDMKCALTEIEENPELNRFYLDCKEAPSLQMFQPCTMPDTDTECFTGSPQFAHSHCASSPPPVATPGFDEQHLLYNSITEQLLHFEAQGREFDDFVNTLSTAEA